ncbi:C4-dicarboxylate TRAP transporter large permease protein DctM (plasmid) [Sulfitobacter sp. DSM 110093]|uniref:TRAP transporter large permease n=1 Tax=Sulfitobacter sp. DSM 110093 TaxID=2883127 RepID=UPI001FADFC0D|nr:TRAP transporter large permease [Sulfitobacter sp. DSM 110093]UOA33894.1 C4-dicarboxylate TRAP transporter large permease protein DctM [Sulfitobacter sp. DSM 110093]
MSDPILGVAGFVAALVLIALGLPVAISMGVIGALGYWYLNGWMGVSYILGSSPFESIFPYSFSVIPLFVMMGVFASHAGLSRSLFNAINAFIGHRRGGLAVTTVGASAFFGAICGSSLATVATIGRVALPEMKRHGYSPSLSTATVAAGGTLGVLIPPSILLVIYGLLTQSSIGQLFIGALVPGILGALLYAGAIMVQVRIKPEMAPPAERAGWGTRLRYLGQVWQVLALFGLVIGGIYLGWFSPTEAAAVGAVGAFFLAVFSGELNREVLSLSVFETAGLTAMIFFILIGAALFNFFLENTGLPQMLIDQIRSSGLGPLSVMVMILIFYVILGCFMDAMSMILLTVPLLAPVALELDFNLIWFGIVVVTVAEIGLITPPIGMNLFVVQAAARDVSQTTVVKGILPFILADILRLAILLAFPAIVLWLPSQTF